MISMNMDLVYRYIDQHSQDFVQDLSQLVKQPSVSAKGEGIQECADMTERILQAVGFSTRQLPEKDGNPVVYGELKGENQKKTLLFYDHYDVQPPEPLEEWKFDAFSGKVYEGRLYGRGSSDNKGNIISRIKAVEAFQQTMGAVPVNVKFFAEGEEEIGSPHLKPVIDQHKNLFSNDATIWEFGGTNFEGHPEIYLGLKGVLTAELKAKGAIRDVHSANAPIIPNPAWRLIWALSTMKNSQDQILVDGFYDNVKRPTKEEIQALKDIPLEEEKLKKTFGLTKFLQGRTGMDAKRELLLSPTCTINGLLTGYTGSGSKTVLPRKAMVKLDFRLVPNQKSDEIFEKLVTHLRKREFGEIEAIKHGSTEPTRTPVTDPFVKIVTKAAEKIYKKKTIVFPTSAGSGPMHLFRNLLNCPVVSAGCSHADAKVHAPNENITVDGFIKGTKFMATIMNDLV